MQQHYRSPQNLREFGKSIDVIASYSQKIGFLADILPQHSKPKRVTKRRATCYALPRFLT